MKISTKGEYGLLALVDLALQPIGAPVQASQIAERQRIPKQYLDQLMLTLKNAGLVDSVRGRQGGYRLARPANAITLLEAVTALEGPLENVNFVEKRRHEFGVQHLLKSVWEELSRQEIAVLQNKTVDDICQEFHKSSSAILYDI